MLFNLQRSNRDPSAYAPRRAAPIGGALALAFVLVLAFAVTIAVTIAAPSRAWAEACCHSGGACTDASANACAGSGGYPMNIGTSCSISGVCDLQACCVGSPDPMCSETDAYTCGAEFFGVAGGAGTDCMTPDVCLFGTDACCMPTGDCAHLDPSYCALTVMGVPGSPDSRCNDPGMCEDLVACCVEPGAAPDGGSCVMSTPDLCLFGWGGDAQVSGSSCATPGICTGGSSTTTSTTTTTTTTTSTTTTSTVLPTCGDGVVAGGEECDDGGTEAGDGCDAFCAVEECWSCAGAPSSCGPVGDGGDCDDGDVCTVGDQCTGGTCLGNAIAVVSACEWVVVGGDPARQVKALIGGGAEIVGNQCADRLKLGKNAVSDGDVVGMRDRGSKVIGVGVGPLTSVTGDLVTGGGGIKATPGIAMLPGLATNAVAPGATATAAGGQEFDATGTHALAAECDAAQAGIDSAASAIDAAGSTVDLGAVSVETSLTLAPGSPAGVIAGQVNLIDFTEIRLRKDAELVLDGGGDAATAYVLRVRGPGTKVAKGKISMLAQSEIVLTGGMSAENLVIYNAGRRPCRFGNRFSGYGTVLCPNATLKLGGAEGAQWQGAFLGGKGIVKIGEKVEMAHVAPFGIVVLP